MTQQPQSRRFRLARKEQNLGRILLLAGVRNAAIVLLLVLGRCESLRCQLTTDSIYSIYTSPSRISDVRAVQEQSSGTYSFVFIEDAGSQSRILRKVFSNESDLREAPVIQYAGTGKIRHPSFLQKDIRVNGIWRRAQYFLWEQLADGRSAIKIMRRDSTRWLTPTSFLESPYDQRGLAFFNSWISSYDIGLTWIENDSVTYVRLTADTISQRDRLKRFPERTCLNPTITHYGDKATVVWEERDTASVLVFASIRLTNNAVSVDTLGGDNLYPRFDGNPAYSYPLVLFSRRDSSAYNLYRVIDPASPPYMYLQQLTHDTVGANFPGSTYTLPLVSDVSERRSQQALIGTNLAYQRVVGDSQAVVRSWFANYVGPDRNEYWTKNKLSEVGITQGFYVYPLVYWVEYDGTTYALKGRPSRVYIVPVELDELLPKTSFLFQNFPNPFNPTTTISYELNVSGFVTLSVFDCLGREISTLVEGVQAAGRHEVKWNAAGLPSGVYIYQLRGTGFVGSRKLLLIK